MKSVFESCKPRDEVLEGALTDDLFAAQLREVVTQKAAPIYTDGRKFFENTFVTNGMRALVQEVMGRVSGEDPSRAPFVRLETAFGGGKTHSLIALYHLARGQKQGIPEELVPPDWIPDAPWTVIGVTGHDIDPTSGVDRDGITVRTLWGEMAWQVGFQHGDAASSYEILRQHDEQLVAPGRDALDKLFGERPVVVMIDEIARHLRSARGQQTASGDSTVAQQTVAFLMTLIEYAASARQCAVVLTLAEQSDAFGEETGALQLELAEARHVSARQERVIRPTEEVEIARIVTHRLFEKIDTTAARETAHVFHDYYNTLDRQGVELPQSALRSDYAAEMERDYPFHPELLTTLNRKTATIPNFQKTRGALRLLARVIRHLWLETRPEDAWLISVHHLDLADEGIRDDLTSRVDRPNMAHVAAADIVSPRSGQDAHATVIDRDWIEAGKPPFAARAATNIFLHSLTKGPAAASGIEPSQLHLSVLQPGDAPDLLSRTLARMAGEEGGRQGEAFWYLHWDARRYRFKTEPSLQKIIDDEAPLVNTVQAKKEIDRRIRSIWKRNVLMPVPFPQEPADLDDDTKAPKLAIMGYDHVTASAHDEFPPDPVRLIFDHTGASQGYRRFKNNLLFLVADRDQVPRMVDIAKRYLAISRINQDPERMNDFGEDLRKRLQNMRDSAEIEVRIAITRAYRYLYYPSADVPEEAGGLARETLPAQDQGDVKQDQSDIVLRALSQLDKILTADDRPLAAAFVNARAWPKGQQVLSTRDLAREFAKRLNLKILLDPNQLKRTIKDGCAKGTWIYFDASEQIGYGPNSPQPLVEISDEAQLYTPEEAQRVQLRIKGEEPPAGAELCPLCGQSPCVCDSEQGSAAADGGAPETPSRPTPVSAHAEAAPAQAFQQVADQFHDRGAPLIGELRLRIEGSTSDASKQLKALGLAVPQLARASAAIQLDLRAEYDDASQEQVELNLAFSWDRYKRVKGAVDTLAQEATALHLTAVLTLRYPEGVETSSSDYQAMRDLFENLELGRIVLEAEQLPDSAKETAR